VAVLLAAAWIGYGLWGGRTGKGKPQPPREALPKPTEQMAVTLFFSDDQAEYLVAEVRRVSKATGASAMAGAVIREVILGPRSGLQPTMPKGTVLRRDPVCQGGSCTLDFSEELVRNHPGGTSMELMTVYSIVESVRANVPGVRAVQILVEGKARETLAGHIAIGGPVQTDPRFIRNQRSSGDDPRSVINRGPA
jgi:germination protein M